MAPASFNKLRALKDQVVVEMRVLKQLRLHAVAASMIRRRPSWKDALPVQAPIRHRITSGNSPSGLLPSLAGTVTLANGAHTAYLSQDQWRSSVLAPLASKYPSNAGIKVMRTEGGVANSQYLHGEGHSAIHARIMHSHRHLSMVANLLYRFGLGPRLYDLTEIEFDGTLHTAYVSRDVGGWIPTMQECQRGIERLRALVADGFVRLVVPSGFDHPDFDCPACNGNAFRDEEHDFLFVDFQNFVLEKYERFLGMTAQEAAEATHFGNTSVIRGGRYLYQTIPGLNRPAKRDIAARTKVLTEMLAEHRIVLRDAIILDIGCNIGMMIGEYLRAGAAWCHGWDLSRVTPYAEKILLAIGCTRFSLTGDMLAKERPLMNDLPSFVRERAEGCIVSYLAIRGHVGWLDALTDIPWSVLIYEGHEGEDESRARALLSELTSATGSQVIALKEYRDGDSEPRIIALVRRLTT